MGWYGFFLFFSFLIPFYYWCAIHVYFHAHIHMYTHCKCIHTRIRIHVAFSLHVSMFICVCYCAITQSYLSLSVCIYMCMPCTCTQCTSYRQCICCVIFSVESIIHVHSAFLFVVFCVSFCKTDLVQHPALGAVMSIFLCPTAVGALILNFFTAHITLSLYIQGTCHLYYHKRLSCNWQPQKCCSQVL